MTDKSKRDKIIPCILAAVVKDGKILLIRRTKDPYKGHWSMPGGKIEFGEHVEEAAIREVIEETGIKCEVECLRGIANEIIHGEDGEEMQFIFFIVQLKPEKTEFVESDEGKLKWHALDTINNVGMPPSDIFMINEFVLKKRELKVHRIKVKRDGDSYDVEEFL